MNIACLGWGSLIWKPGNLPVEGEWHQDGPLFPIEFSRTSDGGELATAICMNAPPVAVLWARMTTQDLRQAVTQLREREGIPDERVDGIGIVSVTADSPGTLAEWARKRDLDAVIWTGLPPKLGSKEGLIPTLPQAIDYLQQLEGEEAEHARAYIMQVPAQIDTPYRRAITARFGWDQ
ncbi:hypothetical protein [Pantoea piersonii]|uniref:hypothetical protein n=1 Tax=Pantoea piersonii TaxID=2364647 RepID=UPI0028AB5AEA|nr:hypothetical protein [Pantoea piersonii]